MPKKKTARNGVAESPPSATRWGRFELMLEKIESQNRMVLEALDLHREEDRRQRAEDAARIDARLCVIEAVVRQNSEDIKQNSKDIAMLQAAVMENSEDIRRNSEDIKRNSEDIAQLRAELTRLGFIVEKMARAEAVEALERRVVVLEDRVGIARPS